MEIHQRLAEFFRRLEAAPPVSSADEALALVCRLIEEVEDDLCALPRRNPPPRSFTGRMYAPQPDHVKPAPSGLKATTRRHMIYCEGDGGITIIHRRSRSVVLAKRGKSP